MQQEFGYISHGTAEYAFAVKILCDHYAFKNDNIVKIRTTPELHELDITNNKHIKLVKSIPCHINIPESMSPKQDHSHLLELTVARSPGSTKRQPVWLGLHEYTIKIDQLELRFWRWTGNQESYVYPLGDMMNFVEKKNLKLFYRILIKLSKRKVAIKIPVLAAGMQEEIYKNSIGFLEKRTQNKALYESHNIPFKRGILLCGKPGTGKTMVCRWLMQSCINKGFSYKIITLEDYEKARSNGHVSTIFQRNTKQPGILFFDDMDVLVKDRKSGTTELNKFLTEMDGIMPTEGSVFIFTTNLVKELDDAFVRPGRIDLFLTFSMPSKKLRERFIREHFHADLLDKISVDDVTEKTHDYSFAELEEIRKLLTFDLLDNKPILVEKTFEIFNRHRKEFEERANFGFGKLDATQQQRDNYYEYDELDNIFGK